MGRFPERFLRFLQLPPFQEIGRPPLSPCQLWWPLLSSRLWRSSLPSRLPRIGNVEGWGAGNWVGGGWIGVGTPQKVTQIPGRLCQAPKDFTKPRQTIPTPERLYKVPTNYKRLNKDLAKPKLVSMSWNQLCEPGDLVPRYLLPGT